MIIYNIINHKKLFTPIIIFLKLNNDIRQLILKRYGVETFEIIFFIPFILPLLLYFRYFTIFRRLLGFYGNRFLRKFDLVVIALKN